MSKLHVFSLPVIVIIITYLRCSSAKLCDIEVWYKGIVDGKVIPKYPTDEQQRIKDYIEKKIANLQHSGSRKMDCDVLEDYKDTLSKKNLKDLSSRVNKRKGKKKKNKETTKEMHDVDLEKKLKDMDEMVKKKTTEVDLQSNTKTPENGQQGAKEIHFDPTESDVDETELSEEEIDQEDTTKENENKQNNQESTEAIQKDIKQNDVNFHNLFEEELKKSKEHSSGEKNYEAVKDEKGMRKYTEERNSENPGETENSLELQNRESHSNFNGDDLSRVKQACDLEDQCSSLCYFRYQNLQSLDQYPSVKYRKRYNSNEYQNRIKNRNDKDVLPNHSETKVQNVQRQINEELIDSGYPVDTKENRPNKKESTEDTIFSHECTEKEITNDAETNSEPKGIHITKTEKEELKSNHDLVKSEKDEKHTSEISSNKQESQQSKPISHPSMSKEHFDLLFQKSASEYSAKIQQLEILLMKLENQLLSKELHKQNDTNTYTKLEFQILKLENELLKLNQSYSRLNEDHEILKNQRGEIEDQLKQKNKYAALPEANTTKHTELINQQQVKITQLTEWLNNQSSILNRLRDKSDHLAEQNQILHQIVMNQTALISNIMQKMQDLSDQNLSHRKETQDLKSKFQIQDASAKIIDRLESLASTRKVHLEKAADESDREVLHREPRRFNFLPDTPNMNINRHQWACSGSNSTQICYMFSLLLTPCPPFSTVYWRKCPKFILEKTVRFFESYVAENPGGDLQTHKPPVQPSIETLSMTGNHKEEIQKDKLKEPLDVKEKKTDNKDAERASNDGDRKMTAGEESRKAVTEKDETVSEKQETDTIPMRLSSGPEKNENEQEKKGIQTGNEESSEKEMEKTKDPEVKEQEEEKEEEEGRPIKYKNTGTRKKAKDCYELYQKGSTRNGVYKIFLPGLKYFVDVFCDMKQGGWTVIQKREGGRLDFYRDWNTYKDGFGSPLDEYYLGNDNIHFLTNQGHYTLLVELTDWKKEKRSATFKDFWVDDENDGYMLHLDGFGGDAGDGLTKHSGMKFSTFDVDNDKVVKQFGGSCAKRFHGAGWYHKCYSSNLNGKFYRNGEVPPKQFDGIAWKPWTGPNYSLKNVVMKVRPKDVLDD